MEMSPHFLERRAKALATVLFTRDPRVRVYESRANSPFDLEAEITSRGAPNGRMFAIEITAKKELSLLGTVQDDGSLKLRAPIVKGLHSSALRAKYLTVPLIFLLLSMENDNAYFGWLRQPLPGVLRLMEGPLGFAERWRENTHTSIVNEINNWYKQAAR
jgi:hypothetical protein